MALPPIFANLPFLKTLKSEDTSVDLAKGKAKDAPEEAERAVFLPQDVVEISRAASRNLDGIKSLSDDEVPAVVASARSQLEETGLSLGLQGGFSA